MTEKSVGKLADTSILTFYGRCASAVMRTDAKRKRVENRLRPIAPSRLPVIVGVHAAKAPPTDADAAALRALYPDSKTVPTGAILGWVKIDECVTRKQAHALNAAGALKWAWADEPDETETGGGYCYHIADVYPLAKPFPASGKQGWWKLKPPLSNDLALQPLASQSL
jgi:hypothetical protein